MLGLLSVTILIAFILIFTGFVLILFSTLRKTTREEIGEKRVEGGAVIVVGPLPIAIGTSERVTRVLLILAIALFTVIVAYYLLLYAR